MTEKPHLFRSSLVVGFFSLLGNLTGIIVEASIAAKLGLSRSSDTFYVAFTVPYLISNLIAATGQFSLVPFFATLEARHSSEDLWKGFSYAANVVFLSLGATAAVGIATAPWLMRGIAPGLTPTQIERAIQLGQWLFLIVIPAGVAEVFRSFLLSQHRFALSSAAGFFRNVTVILLTLLTFGRYGEYSIVLGYLAGTLLQAVILGAQILLAFPVRYSLTLVGSGEAFQNLRGSGVAQALAASAWQVVVIVERIIASFLPPGTLTALNYGFKILGSLVELLAGSVGTASLAGLSRAIALGDPERARKTLRNTLEISLALVSPVTVYCLLLDRNIIRLFFERGNFTPEAAILMSKVFFYYSLSLPLLSCFRILGFYIFARQEMALFIRLAFFQYGLVIALDLFYVGILHMGAIGIPLGLLTASLVTSGLVLQRNLVGLKSVIEWSLGMFAAKNAVAAALAALVVWALRARLGFPQTGFANFLYLCELCGAGSLAFLGVLTASRVITLSRVAAIWQNTRNP